MSSIDLAILGILSEQPQSAYDIQKDVEYHHFSRWTKISIPSVYKKVLRLAEQGYLHSETIRGEKAERAVYSLTEQGKAYFELLMEQYAAQPVSFLFDFNVVVTNLNKLDKEKALTLTARLRESIAASAQTNREQSAEFDHIPLVGRTIFDQQQRLYGALLEWLDGFEGQLRSL